MSSVGTAAMAASVIVGLMTVPVASQAVDGPAVFQELPNVSSADSVPRKVVTEKDRDSFTRKVKTAFSSFRTTVSSGSANASLETPGSRLEVETTPSATVWRLTTPSGVLTVRKSGLEVTESFENSLGTLTVRRVSGETEKSFEGVNRERLEEQHEEALRTLEKMKERLEQKRQGMRRRALPDITVVANSSTASGFGNSDREKIVLENSEDGKVSLKGWKISDSGGNSHEFGEVEIPAGERLHVYTSEPVDPREPYVESTAIAWNDGGDTVELTDSRGRKIDETGY